jgi:hypothetical protein
MRILRMLLLALALITLACDFGSTSYWPQFQTELYRVERDGQTIELAVGQTAFADDWLWTQWVLTHRELEVRMSNTAPHTLRIVWETAEYVTVDGSKHRLRDRGVKRSERQRTKPSIWLEPGAEAVESAFSEPFQFLLPWQDFSGRSRARKFGRSQVGKTVTVIFPVEAASESRRYRFRFKLKGFTLEEAYSWG